MGTLGAVNGDGACLVGPDEVQGVVDFSILTTGDLRGHEVGVYLLCPDILKPFQRHHITKPQMGCLMGNELRTTQQLFLRGVVAEEYTAVAQLYGSRMFHAAKLITGQYHKAIFPERTFNACVSLHPFQ